MNGKFSFVLNDKRNAKTQMSGNTLSSFVVIAANLIYVSPHPGRVSPLAMAGKSKRSQSMEEQPVTFLLALLF